VKKKRIEEIPVLLVFNQRKRGSFEKGKSHREEGRNSGPAAWVTDRQQEGEGKRPDGNRTC